MLAFAAALMNGPEWAPSHPSKTRAWRLCAPLLAGVAVLLAAAIGGLGTFQSTGQSVLRDLAVGSLATLTCLALAVPAALARPNVAWLLAVWLSLSAGQAGWTLIQGPGGQAWAVVQIAGLLLPLMVLLLAGGWAAIPRNRWSSASCAGASGIAMLTRVVLPLAWPGILRGCALLWPLAADAARLLRP